MFTNIELREITDEEIENFSYTYQGLDFGWFPDPAHWSKVCYNPAQLTLYIFDELRVRKTPNRELWERLQTEKGVTYSDLITADSAEPKSIGDFKSYGASMRPTIKGPDSVRYSMKWLQSLKRLSLTLCDARNRRKSSPSTSMSAIPMMRLSAATRMPITMRLIVCGMPSTTCGNGAATKGGKSCFPVFYR